MAAKYRVQMYPMPLRDTDQQLIVSHVTDYDGRGWTGKQWEVVGIEDGYNTARMELGAVLSKPWPEPMQRWDDNLLAKESRYVKDLNMMRVPSPAKGDM